MLDMYSMYFIAVEIGLYNILNMDQTRFVLNAKQDSVVMLHDDSADDFLFYSPFLPRLKLYLAIRNAPTFSPLLHGGCDIVVAEPIDSDALQHRAVRQGHKF